MSNKEHDELSDDEIAKVTGAGTSAQSAPGRRSMSGEPSASGGVEETNTTPGGGTGGSTSGNQTGGKGGLTP